MRPAAIIFLAVFFAISARAEEPAPQRENTQTPESAQKPVAAFGADHPECLEWTDGCVICRRQPDGSPACSTVGAACLPATAVCRDANAK